MTAPAEVWVEMQRVTQSLPDGRTVTVIVEKLDVNEPPAR